MNAKTLIRLLSTTSATAIRLTPWRLLILEGAKPVVEPDVITQPNDPLLTLHACPGAPSCASATVETRKLARALTAHAPSGLHISGCAKGCAHPRRAALTLTGSDGRFDLVKDGAPWDAPNRTGLAPEDLAQAIGTA